MAERKHKVLWMVDDRDDGKGGTKAYWTKVGIAFENKDGSFSLELEALPVSGRMQMRDPPAPTNDNG